MADQVREAFEAWCLKEGRLPAGLKRRGDGEYFYDVVQSDWESWQAATASHAADVEALRSALKAVLDDLDIGAHPHLHIEQIRAALKGDKP